MKDILRFKSKVISTIKIAAEDKLPSSVYKEKYLISGIEKNNKKLLLSGIKVQQNEKGRKEMLFSLRGYSDKTTIRDLITKI
jgi:hypothetical protein